MRVSIKKIRIIFAITIFLCSFSVLTFALDSSTTVIKNGDRLNIKVLEQAELGGAYIVSDDGTILFPLIDKKIVCEGKTYEKVAEDIKNKLEADFFYKATVIVTPSDGTYFSGRNARNGGTIYVYGKVNRQGAIKIPKGEVLTASKAIIRSGGFQEFANKRQVKLVRKASMSGKATTIVLNMVEIIDQGKLDKDVELIDGDTIVVPEQFFNF